MSHEACKYLFNQNLAMATKLSPEARLELWRNGLVFGAARWERIASLNL